MDAFKPLSLEQFLSNSSYILGSFNNKLLITAYSIIVLIYIGIVAGYNVPI